ncbi:hypothetical protein GCM10022294_12180 [Dietzia aurantiaca]|nr:hypothetical protein NCCP2495_22060 [Dietzia sp. NCCP-2495]
MTAAAAGASFGAAAVEVSSVSPIVHALSPTAATKATATEASRFAGVRSGAAPPASIASFLTTSPSSSYAF